MKGLAFVSGLLGVAAGLLFGMLLWGRAGESVALPAGTSARDTEVLAALRDVRSSVDRLSQDLRLVAGTVAHPAAAQVESLAPSAPAVSLDELKVALDQMLRELRDDVASGGSSLTALEVNPGAADEIAALCASVKPQRDLSRDLLLLTPSDVYRRFGRPAGVIKSAEGGMSWMYGTTGSSPAAVVFSFSNGYVVSATRTQ